MAIFSIFDGLISHLSADEFANHPRAPKEKQPIGHLFPKGLHDQPALDPFLNLYKKFHSHYVDRTEVYRTCEVFKKVRDATPETTDTLIQKLEENLQVALKKRISAEERHRILSNYTQFSQKPSSDAIFHFAREVDVYQTFLNQKGELARVLENLKLHQDYPVDPIRDPKIKEFEAKLKKLTAGIERQGKRMIDDLHRNSIIDAQEVQVILKMVQSRHLPDNFFDRLAHWIQHFKNTHDFQKIVSDFQIRSPHLKK